MKRTYPFFHQTFRRLFQPPASSVILAYRLLIPTQIKRKTRRGVIIHLFLLPGILGRPPLPTNKLSLATWESYNEVDHKGPGTYAFGYDIEDPVAGNVQFRQEERYINGTVVGTYGYVDAYGNPFVVNYIADDKGYRAKIARQGNPARYFPTSNFLTKKFFLIPSYSANVVDDNSYKYMTNFLNDANIVEYNYS